MLRTLCCVYCTVYTVLCILYCVLCTVFVLGRDEGYMVKYPPSPEGVPKDEAKGTPEAQLFQASATVRQVLR